MSYNQYSGYGGNPYGGEEQAGGYGTANPYAGTGGASGGTSGGYGQVNPYSSQGYGQGAQTGALQPPQIRHETSNYSQQTLDSDYSNQQLTGGSVGGQRTGTQQTEAQSAGPTHLGTANHPPTAGVPGQIPMQSGPTVLSNQDFLSRVEAAKADIRTLTQQIGGIASAHQRTLSSTDSSSSSALESIITQTQVLNTSIKDQIKFLETDAARSGDNQIKNTQVSQLKLSFRKQLEEYRNEEASYERRYREQIARQYRIVNPDATEQEVQEASQADWGNEGVFQTALKTNRTATASTVLGAVRARHNDIQRIERTLLELNQLFQDLAEAVVVQEPMIQQAEQHTENVKNDTEAGNVQLDKGIKSAKNARRLKWWLFWIIVLIICILALVLGLYFGLKYGKK